LKLKTLEARKKRKRRRCRLWWFCWKHKNKRDRAFKIQD